MRGPRVSNVSASGCKGAGIHVEGPLDMENVYVEKSGIGLSLENAAVTGRNVVLSDLGNEIEHRNSSLKFEGLKIDRSERMIVGRR